MCTINHGWMSSVRKKLFHFRKQSRWLHTAICQRSLYERLQVRISGFTCGVYRVYASKDRLFGPKSMVSQGRWSLVGLVTGSFTLKWRSFCQKLVVLQDRWSLMAVVSQHRLYCILLWWLVYVSTCTGFCLWSWTRLSLILESAAFDHWLSFIGSI